MIKSRLAVVEFGIALWAIASSNNPAFGAVFSPGNAAALISAITTANVNGEDDVIDLGSGTISLSEVQSTTDGQNGLPSITEATFSLTIQNGTIERAGAAPAFRLLHVAATGTLILKDVTLSNGLAQESGAGVGQGGAIFSRGALASIDGCTFSNNVASGANGLLGPADALGGAIYLASGTLGEIKGSTFDANLANGGDALISILAGAGDGLGGALHFAPGSSVGQVSDTVFHANGATGGQAVAGLAGGGTAGRGWGAAIYADDVTWTGLKDSNFASNVAAGGNGAASAFASFPGGDAAAGAVYLDGGTLDVVEGTAFTANEATGGNAVAAPTLSGTGGDALGGAIHLGATSTIGSLTTSIFSGNRASGGQPATNGAMLAAGGDALGGALDLGDTSAILNLATSTFSENQAVGANALSVVGGAIHNAGALRIVESTLSANHAGNGGLTCTPQPSGDGGAIYNAGTLTLVNGTLSGNAAGSGGLFCDQADGGDGGAIYNVGVLKISHATVNGNTAGLGASSGGGVFNTGTAGLRNTIVAFNSAHGLPSNCDGTITASGSNLADDASCGFGPGNGVDPLLLALGNNGGPTQTIALQPSSPAIDGVPDGECTDLDGNAITTDQRGFARPIDGPDPDSTPLCDIGALERASVCDDPYRPLSPVRILDTRNGRMGGPIGPGGTITLSVLGIGGVPASGVAAVVVNVTAVDATGTGNLRVYPSDAPSPPLVSNVNFRAGENTPNLVIAKVGSDGKIKIHNGSGAATVDVVGDVHGFFVDPSVSYGSLSPVRILDTRSGTGGVSGPIGPGETITLSVLGVGGVPADGVSAVVLNVTAAEGTGSGNLRVFPSDEPSPPLVSNLNFQTATNRANLVIAKLGSDGKIKIHNGSAGATVHAVADTQGFFSTASLCYGPLSPVRILDTRNGLGGTSGPIGPGQTFNLTVAGAGGVPGSGAAAVVLNVTAANGTGNGTLSVFPSDESPPALISNLEFRAGVNVPNLVIVKVGPDGGVKIHNGSAAASVEVIADTQGSFRAAE